MYPLNFSFIPFFGKVLSALMKENISLKSPISLAPTSRLSIYLLYQSKVPKLQILLVLFTLPLRLFGVATAGSAVRGVKVCSDMAITSTPESALKLTVFPQTFSSLFSLALYHLL